MTWQDYETTVRNIYEMLGKAIDVKIECYGGSCKRLGKSSVPHQIDILTSHSDGVHTYYTAIECKYWNEKVNKDIVMKVEAISNDCNFDKTVVVSKIGFTEDAITYAKFINVRLVELKEKNISINENELTKFYMNLEITKPVFFEISLIINPKTKEETKSSFFKNNVYEYYVVKNNKDKILFSQLIRDFLNAKVLKSKEEGLITDSILFGDKAYLKYPKSRRQFLVEGVKLTGYAIQYTKLDDDYFENKIWMIMKLLFEEKDYIVTFDGKIELPKPKEPLKLTVGETNLLSLKVIVKKFKLLKLK